MFPVSRLGSCGRRWECVCCSCSFFSFCRNRAGADRWIVQQINALILLFINGPKKKKNWFCQLIINNFGNLMISSQPCYSTLLPTRSEQDVSLRFHVACWSINGSVSAKSCQKTSVSPACVHITGCFFPARKLPRSCCCVRTGNFVEVDMDSLRSHPLFNKCGSGAVRERAVERDVNRAIETSYRFWRAGSCEEAAVDAAGRCVHYLSPDFVAAEYRSHKV